MSCENFLTPATSKEGLNNLGLDTKELISHIGQENKEGVSHIGLENKEVIGHIGLDSKEVVNNIGLDSKKVINNLGPENKEDLNPLDNNKEILDNDPKTTQPSLDNSRDNVKINLDNRPSQKSPEVDNNQTKSQETGSYFSTVQSQEHNETDSKTSDYRCTTVIDEDRKIIREETSSVTVNKTSSSIRIEKIENNRFSSTTNTTHNSQQEENSKQKTELSNITATNSNNVDNRPPANASV